MLKYKFNASIITYWISCLMVYFIVTWFGILNPDFLSISSIVESFLVVAYVILFGTFLYFYPISIFVQILINKIPENKNTYKFILYMFFATLFSLIFMIGLLGMSFFAIIVILLYLIIEELVIKYKDTKKYKTVLGLSYIISIFIFGLCLYQFLSFHGLISMPN